MDLSPRWLRLLSKGSGSVFVDSLFIVTPIVGVYVCSMFYCTLLYVPSSFAIIMMGKRELAAILNLSSWCLLIVFFFALICGAMGLSAAGGCVFPKHTHLLFDIFSYIITFRCHILIKRVMRS